MKYFTPVLCLGSIALIAILSASFTPHLPEASMTFHSFRDSLSQVIRPVPLDTRYTFAGEEIPIARRDVLERLDRELTVNSHYHSSTLQILKRSHRYFEIIEPILRQNGVPDDFKYLAVAESGLREVTSPAGAKGVWQFMKGTGKQYGLEITTEVDERYHLEKATKAACEYLLDLKERMGSWTLVAASYNAGENKIDRLRQEQRAQSYFDLNINEETMRYVFRIVALKSILSDPQRYGFYLDEDDYYPTLGDIQLLEVTETVPNWGDFAIAKKTDYRTLKILNPWLIAARLTNTTGKQYIIKVPKK